MKYATQRREIKARMRILDIRAKQIIAANADPNDPTPPPSWYRAFTAWHANRRMFISLSSISRKQHSAPEPSYPMRTASQYEIVLALCKLSVENEGNDDLQYKLWNLAADAAGIPVDNTSETRACDKANETGEWPFYAYCRDKLFDHFMNEGDPVVMAAIAMSWNEKSR